MPVHINNATNEQLDYAVAVAQNLIEIDEEYGALFIGFRVGEYSLFSNGVYHPTTDQAQAGDLLTKFGCEVYPHRISGLTGWAGKIEHDGNGNATLSTENETWMMAVVKVVLWRFYPDGMIPTIED